jgi:hypothetical protein
MPSSSQALPSQVIPGVFTLLLPQPLPWRMGDTLLASPLREMSVGLSPDRESRSQPVLHHPGLPTRRRGHPSPRNASSCRRSDRVSVPVTPTHAGCSVVRSVPAPWMCSSVCRLAGYLLTLPPHSTNLAQ